MKVGSKYQYQSDSEFRVTKIDGDDIYVTGKMFGKPVLDWVIKKGSLMQLLCVEI